MEHICQASDININDGGICIGTGQLFSWFVCNVVCYCKSDPSKFIP